MEFLEQCGLGSHPRTAGSPVRLSGEQSVQVGELGSDRVKRVSTCELKLILSGRRKLGGTSSFWSARSCMHRYTFL